MMGQQTEIELILPERFSFDSLRKTFGRLSDTSKKAERTSAVNPEHYINNKVFVSPFHVLGFDSAFHQEAGHGPLLSVSNRNISSRIVCSTVVRAAGFCL